MNRPEHVPLVRFKSSKPFPAEMKIYFNEHRLTFVREHQVEACDVDPRTPGKCEDGSNTFLLQLRPALMIKFSAPADIVVKPAAANAKIAHRMVSIYHHPKVFPAVLHPLLDKKRGVLGERKKMSGYFARLVNRKNRVAPAAKISFEHEWISPGRAVQVQVVRKLTRGIENEGFRAPDPHLFEEISLFCLALEIEPGLKAREPIPGMASYAPVSPWRNVRRQQHAGSLPEKIDCFRVIDSRKRRKVFFHFHLGSERDTVGTHR